MLTHKASVGAQYSVFGLVAARRTANLSWHVVGLAASQAAGQVTVALTFDDAATAEIVYPLEDEFSAVGIQNCFGVMATLASSGPLHLLPN